MAKYRVTRARNVRLYETVEFQAPDDRMAVDLIKHGNVSFDTPDRVDDGNADHPDVSYMLDDITNIEKEDPREVDVLVDTDSFPYSTDSVRMVKDIANWPEPEMLELNKVTANDGQHLVNGLVYSLRRLRAQARQICGLQ